MYAHLCDDFTLRLNNAHHPLGVVEQAYTAHRPRQNHAAVRERYGGRRQADDEAEQQRKWRCTEEGSTEMSKGVAMASQDNCDEREAGESGEDARERFDK